MSAGILYFNDKPMVVREILESHITPNTEDEKEPMLCFRPDSNECTFTMELPYRNTKRMCLSSIYGRMIANNWLKMHGWVMTRKVARRKRTL